MQAKLTAHLVRRLLGQRLHLWWYYRVMHMFLKRSPRVIWRAPAFVSACARMVFDDSARALARGLSGALGRRTWRARWGLRWSLCFQYEAEQLLTVQADKLSQEWITNQIRIRGALPPDGAILVSVHHLMRWPSYQRLALSVDHIGNITMEPQLDNLTVLAQVDAVTQRQLRARHGLQQRKNGPRDFYWHNGSREVLHFLAEGGYAIFLIDVFIHGWPPGTVFDKLMPIPRGPIWFAKRTGKPIIPLMLTPARQAWELIVGDAIEPTHDALAQALEECIRRAPSMWRRDHATAWLHAPNVPHASLDDDANGDTIHQVPLPPDEDDPG